MAVPWSSLLMFPTQPLMQSRSRVMLYLAVDGKDWALIEIIGPAPDDPVKHLNPLFHGRPAPLD